MAKLERVYNIPLRREWLKKPDYKRAKKAVSAVREFLSRHMKSDNIKLGKHLNEDIWKRGIKNPPHHIKVTAVKYDEGLVRAELVGFPIEEPKKEKKGKLAALKEKVTGKKKEEKAEEKPQKSEISGELEKSKISQTKSEAPKAEEMKKETPVTAKKEEKQPEAPKTEEKVKKEEPITEKKEVTEEKAEAKKEETVKTEEKKPEPKKEE